MPDETTPAGQTPPAAGDPVDWEARFKGLQASLQPKYEAALGTIKTTQEELASKDAAIAQLQAQLSQAGLDKDAVTASFQSQIKELSEKTLTQQNELANLKRLDHKIKAAKEAGATDVLGIIDAIPYAEDPEQQIQLIKELSSWADGKVKAREAQLTAGETPPIAVTAVQSAPTTADGWKSLISSLPLGSADRKKAMQGYFKWGVAQNK